MDCCNSHLYEVPFLFISILLPFNAVISKNIARTYCTVLYRRSHVSLGPRCTANITTYFSSPHQCTLRAQLRYSAVLRESPESATPQGNHSLFLFLFFVFQMSIFSTIFLSVQYLSQVSIDATVLFLDISCLYDECVLTPNIPICLYLSLFCLSPPLFFSRLLLSVSSVDSVSFVTDLRVCLLH